MAIGLLGRIGAGMSTLLVEIMEPLLAEAQAEPWRPVPVYVDLDAMPSRIEPVDGVIRLFTQWFAAQLRLRYGMRVSRRCSPGSPPIAIVEWCQVPAAPTRRTSSRGRHGRSWRSRRPRVGPA